MKGQNAQGAIVSDRMNGSTGKSAGRPLAQALTVTHMFLSFQEKEAL